MDSGKFTEEILTILKERMGDVEIMVCDVARNNGIRLAGLTIRDRACNIAPCITLEDFCQVHSEGRKSLGDIADEIIQVYQKNKAGHCFDLSAFTDYSHAKTLLHGRLINTEKNAELLGKRPHREFLDLSLVYCMEFPCPDIGGAGSMQVMDAHMGTGRYQNRSCTGRLWRIWGILRRRPFIQWLIFLRGCRNASLKLPQGKPSLCIYLRTGVNFMGQPRY